MDARQERRVHRLRLRCEAPAQVAQLSHVSDRIGDALRCASVPGAPDRVLLVRRLDLGRLPTGLSSQRLAMLIEQRLVALGGTWVHGDDDRAATSEAVVFASRLQAAQAAVRRRALGHSLTAWHWRLALPGLRTDASDQTFLHSVVAVLAREPVASVSLPALVADVVAAGHAPWLIRCMPEETAAQLVSVCGAKHHMTHIQRQQGTSAPSQAIRYAWRSLAGRPHQTWIPVAWSAWLHAVLRAAQWVPESVPQEMVRSHQARQAPDQGVGPGLGAESLGLSGGQVHFTPAESLEVMPLAAPHDSDVGPSLNHAVVEPAHFEDASTLVEQAFAALYEPESGSPFDSARPTRAGGLLLLINLLDHLGFAEWQSRHPEAPLCGLILSKALQRLDVSPDDPAWGLAASLPCPSTPWVCHWQIPPVWGDDRIGVSCDAAKAHTAEAMASLWLTACRRYLRRVVHIGLFSCVCRTAQLRWSATHLDTFFDLRATDLRVRRSALDLDPGWLPWLGRVVSFHYQQGGHT